MGVTAALQDFLNRLDLLTAAVIVVNVLLMVFAGRVFAHIGETGKAWHRWSFRLFSLLVIGSFIFYHLYLPVDSQDWSYQAFNILFVLYIAYLTLQFLHYFITKKYGKIKEVDGVVYSVDTYRSRLLNITASIFVFIIAFVSLIRLLGYAGLLEAGGAIGLVGVFLALTQASWAPDMFSGLVILNSKIVETGDVIEFDDAPPLIGVVFKTKLFYTEILDLVTNHRVMIRNAKLREKTIHNLSKFASARGLRERLIFKIGYHTKEEQVYQMFRLAFDRAVADTGVDIEEQYPIEVGVNNAGDHAVEWCCYYYTKDVRHVIATRQAMREHILKTSKEMGISLATPVRHDIEHAMVALARAPRK